MARMAMSSAIVGGLKHHDIPERWEAEGMTLLQAILGHPLALVKLGMFLRDVNALRHSYEAKPTIIIGPADAQGDCLIVAVTKEPIGQAGQVC